MIPSNLKSSRCHCAALSLPVMGKEEFRRVPRLPGHLVDEFRDKLAAIADQAPHAHTAVQARELMESLPRAPVDGRELYTAGAGEIDQAYVGTVFKAASGQWAYRIETPEGPVAGGGGFDDQDEAWGDMQDVLASLEGASV